jgi:hypothetical protein
MTVSDLIKKLTELPADYSDYNVKLEGCDCYGDWNGEISFSYDDDDEDEEKYVLLKRTH